jgi:tRNA pseudouridine38-40 synthase
MVIHMNNLNISENKRNIMMILTYDGNHYSGWQRLGNEGEVSSIQGVIETVLSSYLGEMTRLIGSGRTDAGVHALGQVINFHTHSGLSLEVIKKDVNQLLPDDIQILSVKEVDINFHSRYSAKEKTYEYRIELGERQCVFTRKYTLHMPYVLDIGAMKEAASYFIGTHNFIAFSTDRKDGKSTVRTIRDINIYFEQSYKSSLLGGDELRISITGNGFLYNMVRIIVGTLLEVGQGLKKPVDIIDILRSENRQKAGITISSQGLFLKNVKYE